MTTTIETTYVYSNVPGKELQETVRQALSKPNVVELHVKAQNLDGGTGVTWEDSYDIIATSWATAPEEKKGTE